ncbi:ROK family transcriptional regulator [Microbacterium aurugineum]|uniref:ROK family transcriptional regulator n=1 Tax=Microbacterium aurugineum TaxID=2851642 RepID=UPI000CB50ACA|nr:ROK family protein [Microbacterium aurugineum]MCK8478802.1 ROK family protein [Microbacterium aurugineum]PKQ34159.1 MAG: sugar kinase [Actinobacteria bacterium HGW-Actinobacteria-11]
MVDVLRPAPAISSGAGEIFQILRDGHARTKAELAALTGLARSTVALRVDALLAAGLLRPAGEAASTGGRPPARVAFNPRAGLVLAVDLGATHATVAVADLAGVILDSRTRTIDIGDGPERLLDTILTDGGELLRATSDEGLPLVGVGIGVPGPVEHSTGRPTNPPIMPGWDRFDVPAYVQRTFDVPVLVDNDVNILALGEQATSWPQVDDLIFVKVSTGIGAGIIAGGQLQRGAQGSAGDMGHVQVPSGAGSTREPDDDRDLEALASGSALAIALRAEGLDAHSPADVVALVRSGNTSAIEATRQAGRHVGEVLATVVNLLNPSIIVLGGSIARAGEHLLAGVREIVYRRSIPLATQHLAIVQSQAGDRAAVLGAAIMVAREVLSPASVDRYVAAKAR